MDMYGPTTKKTGGSAIDDMFAKIRGGSAANSKPTEPRRGGGIVDDLSKLAVPLGLIAAKEGVEYLANKRSKNVSKGKGKVGGGLVEDMANLAIPLGFVAAERVLSSHLSKRDGKTKKTPKPKSTPSMRGRMAAFGGNGEYGADAIPTMGGYSDDLVPMSSGGSDTFFDTIVHTLPKKGGSSDTKMTPPTKSMGGGRYPVKRGGSGDMDMYNPSTGGGYGEMDSMKKVKGGKGNKPSKGGAAASAAAMASRHAAIAAEFRNMAAEIGSFLENKAAVKK